jgi:type I restriction enzyme S subunit
MMSRAEHWTQTRLGDHLQIKHGYAFKGEYFGDEGPFVVLTPGNFYDEGGFKAKEQEKYYTGEVPEGYILQRGDLLVAMTEQAHGLLGSSAIIPQDDLYLHNQRLGLVVDLDESVLDRRYLHYLFNTRGVRNQIQATATGTKVRHTSPSRIGDVKVMLPPLASQQRIAGILSAYDDLIENNTRRIAILEKMAQAIYGEWFVNFRFPGHEQMEMVESELGPVPAGWEVNILGQLAEEIRRSVDPEQLDPDVPYFGLEHLPRRSIALADWGRAADVQSTKLSFRKGEILFGKIRPYFHKVGVAPLDGICSSDTIVIVPKVEHYSGLVLACVSSDAFVAYATQTSQGTKMPRANWSVLVEYPVVTPPSGLLRQFNEIMDSVVGQIHNLIFRNRNLRQTRDLLLPKLISGEIELAALEEELAGAA